MSVIIASYVAPMNGPVIRDGAVIVRDGRIVNVTRAAQFLGGGDEEVTRLDGHVLVPGLVNAHTHLEHSLAECGPSWEGTFCDWILAARARSKLDPENLQSAVHSAVRRGVEQSLRFGVTCLGDISQHSVSTRMALSAMPRRPRVVSFAEALGLAGLRGQFEQHLSRALDEQCAADDLLIGLTPHAPYTVDRPGYEQCLRMARLRNYPLATHLAETPDEQAFLEHHTGPFREIWDRLNLWSEPVETFLGSPIRFAHAIGLLDYPTLLAHVNYCDDEELDLLSRGHASVVYCPRTHAYFRHAPHRWREMLARGINVAVGTDSCGSSPDLNLVDDLRLLHRIAPELPAHALWEMATTRAARALRWEDEVGSLAPGRRADLAAFRVRGWADDPLRDVLETDALPSRVWIGGT